MPVRIALATLMVATLLLTPALSQAQVRSYDDRDNGRDYPRMTAVPPIIIILSEWKERHGWLPPGLARLLERYEDYYGPIDEDDDHSSKDPELENTAEEVEETSASLMFEFSEDVQARLFVGTESGFRNNDDGVMKLVHTNYDDEHEFALDNLESDTEYFYRVRFRDEDGNHIMSDEMSFMTEEEADTGNGDDPELENVEENIEEAAASLDFEFSEEVRVRFFASDESGFANHDAGVMRQSHTNFSTQHEFALDNLESDTEYYYRVHYRDRDGNTVMSDEMSFTTGEEDDEDGEDTTDPVVESLTAEAGTSTAEIEVTFDEPAKVRLLVSEVDGFNNQTADLMVVNHNNLNAEHVFMLDELTPDTEYFYRLRYLDEAGNVNLSQQMSLTTDAHDDEDDDDTIAPVISDVAGVAGATSITGSFMTDEPTTATIYTSTDSGFGLDEDGVMTTEENTLKTEHELTITGLASSTTYYHIIVAEDEAGNTTESDEFTFGTN